MKFWALRTLRCPSWNPVTCVDQSIAVICRFGYDDFLAMDFFSVEYNDFLMMMIFFYDDFLAMDFILVGYDGDFRIGTRGSSSSKYHRISR
ncbi:unnamed protein product [Gongylonema pulchrum]|uniref:SRCR domain-containing protein n=1 Tax=Gongylonema pulchrum TaxID=637853 RepID=A0A183EJR2_9BILA|nr:unnamed protein product [Gongylonema pulchrum]